ncbi:Scavenger receptor class B member 1 [Oryzias melastigma]|uniref:Scavenger receptor class B member 1 n=1 Tax=Oryzias melastigma TaxID=30732 RepID=A0A834C5L1_ORYME|nr:Scavenger receptor class B member 1 [Oryzias melastigma]
MLFVLIVGPISTAAQWWNQTRNRISFFCCFWFLNAVWRLLPPFQGNVMFCMFVSRQLTGVPLNVSIRLQLNLYIKRVSGITETGKISEVVMPLLWFEENGYIDGPILNTFRTNLVVLPAVMEYLQYILIALGLLTVIVASVVHHKVKRSLNAAEISSVTENPGASANGQVKGSHGSQEKSLSAAEK